MDSLCRYFLICIFYLLVIGLVYTEWLSPRSGCKLYIAKKVRLNISTVVLVKSLAQTHSSVIVF